MTLLESAPRTAQTSAPVLDVLAERWSPRAFDPDAVLEAGALAGVFEAARWAPSASNTQPWRFIIARRGTETFETIAATLMGFNQMWAGSAAALVVNIAVTADAEGNPMPWAQYDLGQAVAHLSVQAHAEGLHVHQMGGFDRAAISAAFDLAESFVPTSVMTIGKLGDAAALPEALREREVAPRVRLALDEIVLLNN
ncbi:nitroreductase family protein [Microterricola pindariensis]|uniref:Nitroreductase n=1 Tax=Microterricola pindariensis TaxID=478010 RepID=A0ABX5B1C9_9MICO|nr:nitroreductase family protein [Microterricola pindariensis]PPL20376.1 nitroreductase [Microterricola pindariensis]